MPQRTVTLDLVMLFQDINYAFFVLSAKKMKEKN